MEFNKKLQALRKQKNITQEELAEAIYVSRTAVSKWESGRGYPNIDSLKELAKFFSVTIDELLSSDEVINIAKQDINKKQNLIFSLFDISVAMFLFLPLFSQKLDEVIYAVSLLSLTEIQPYLKVLYFVLVIATILFGILSLALQNCQKPFWEKVKSKISLALNFSTLILFIISSQPYASIFMLVFIAIKTLPIAKTK